MAATDAGATEAGRVRWLTFLLFAVFALTTDAIGVVIPAVVGELGLSLTQASAFHYTTMIAIAVSGVLLGPLADRIGRRPTILIGLALFVASCGLIAVAQRYGTLLILLGLSGLAIGIFKTAALALVGDLSRSTSDHTRTMNTLEGYFGIGAIAGPALVSVLLAQGSSWKGLYLIAAGIGVALIGLTASVRYPPVRRDAASPFDLRQTLALLRDPWAVGFSIAVALYVSVEAAVYVWLPTLLAGAGIDARFAAAALPAFFALRAAGRFLGAPLSGGRAWATTLAAAGTAIVACFAGTLWGGAPVALWLLPSTGLFMSVIYPTLNSKSISGFDRRHHGAAAGVLLGATCTGAVLGPLALGIVADAAGSPLAGFAAATALAGLLCAGLIWNAITHPTAARLARREQADYQVE